MKRVPRWSRYALFRCHDAIYLRARAHERERERERTKFKCMFKKKKYA